MIFLATSFDSLNRFFGTVWVQNCLIVSGFGILAWFLIVGSRNEQWQRAWRRLRRDRIGVISGIVIALYLVVGSLESIQMTNRSGEQVSILGLLTQSVPVEKSYSAPLAATSLSTTKPEPIKGRHLFGTTALGKDTFVE